MLSNALRPIVRLIAEKLKAVASLKAFGVPEESPTLIISMTCRDAAFISRTELDCTTVERVVRFDRGDDSPANTASYKALLAEG